jgi:putative hemolysin
MNRSRPGSVLFEDRRVAIVLATHADAPDLIQRLAQLRALSFGPRRLQLGFDSYDALCHHVVALDRATGQIVGGSRVGDGATLLASRGPEAFVAARYWTFLPSMCDLAARSVEVSRTWVEPGRRRDLRTLASLWKGIARFLRETPSQYLFGHITFMGYPLPAVAPIVRYLLRFHSLPGAAPEPLIRARHPLPAPLRARLAPDPGASEKRTAFAALVAELARLDTAYTIPALLRRYILEDALLAGEPAWDPHEEKTAVLLYAPTARAVQVVERWEASPASPSPVSPRVAAR